MYFQFKKREINFFNSIESRKEHKKKPGQDTVIECYLAMEMNAYICMY